jgi:hypothetical protein
LKQQWHSWTLNCFLCEYHISMNETHKGCNLTNFRPAEEPLPWRFGFSMSNHHHHYRSSRCSHPTLDDDCSGGFRGHHCVDDCCGHGWAIGIVTASSSMACLAVVVVRPRSSPCVWQSCAGANDSTLETADHTGHSCRGILSVRRHYLVGRRIPPATIAVPRGYY